MSPARRSSVRRVRCALPPAPLPPPTPTPEPRAGCHAPAPGALTTWPAWDHPVRTRPVPPTPGSSEHALGALLPIPHALVDTPTRTHESSPAGRTGVLPLPAPFAARGSYRVGRRLLQAPRRPVRCPL